MEEEFVAKAADTITERALELARLAVIRRIITAVAVVISALVQAFLIQAFVNPANLLPSGFTGIAVLIDRITSLWGIRVSTDLGMLALNIPLALICWSRISKRFVLFSSLQVVLAAAFLRFCDFQPLLDDQIMLVVFGGFISGISIAIALKAGASTGGTDFISLLVANKTGKTIWGFIFAGNCALILIFGAIFGWESAAYSIVFQFISTKTIDSFYHRYDRVTLQITTKLADEVMDAYIASFQHGISCAEVIGGYSRERMYLLHTVVSTYESEDIVRLVREVDPGAVINVFRTDNFIGGWWHGHVDEPVPTAVPDPTKQPAREAAKRRRATLMQDDGR